MRNPMNINKHNCHYPTSSCWPLFQIYCDPIWQYGFHFEKSYPNNLMFLISPVQPRWCQYMTISTLLDICVLIGFPRKRFVMQNLDVYLNVWRKNVKQTVKWPIEIGNIRQDVHPKNTSSYLKKQLFKLFETAPRPNTHRIIDIYISIFDVKYMIS